MSASSVTRLSRRIWGRRPERACLFWFDAAQAPHLVIEAATARGRQAFDLQLASLTERYDGPLGGVQGALLADQRGRFVFCGEGLNRSFLAALSDWVRAHHRRIPALTSFAEAGVVDTAIEPDAIGSLRAEALQPLRDASLWQGLIEPSVADTAAVVEHLVPGERCWFWLRSDSPPGALPVVVRRVHTDPAMEQLNQLVEAVAPTAPCHVGLLVCTHTGAFQLQTHTTPVRNDLWQIARLVRDFQAQHPGLLRFRDAEILAVDESGVVQQVISDPTLWEGLPVPVRPGTPAHAAQGLSRLGEGQRFWFVATARAAWGAPLLYLLPVEDDPEGEQFNQQIAPLASLAEGPLVGTGRRLANGTLLFSTRQDVAGWGRVKTAILEQFAESQPALRQLEDAALVQLGGGGITSASRG